MSNYNLSEIQEKVNELLVQRKNATQNLALYTYALRTTSKILEEIILQEITLQGFETSILHTSHIVLKSILTSSTDYDMVIIDGLFEEFVSSVEKYLQYAYKHFSIKQSTYHLSEQGILSITLKVSL